MDEPDHTQAGRRRYEFGLREVLGVFAFLLVVISFVVGAQEGSVGLAFRLIAFPCVVLMAPVALTIGLVYGRGFARTFCIGAMIPATTFLLHLAVRGFPPEYFLKVLHALSAQWAGKGALVHRIPIYPDEVCDFMKAFYTADLLISLAAGVFAVGLRCCIDERRRSE